MNVALYNPQIQRPLVSEWMKVRVCSECYGYLDSSTFYDNDGLCPHCGHQANSTICDELDIVYRKVYTIKPKWYELWIDEEYFIEAKDSNSREALLKMHSL